MTQQVDLIDQLAPPGTEINAINLESELAKGPQEEKPHTVWRFRVLSGALVICLLGGFSPFVPAESRTAALALAGSIITSMAKPLEGMDP